MPCTSAANVLLPHIADGVGILANDGANCTGSDVLLRILLAGLFYTDGPCKLEKFP
jgi:hypothetical protein